MTLRVNLFFFNFNFHRCFSVSGVIFVHVSRLRGTGQGLGDANKDLSVIDGEMNEVSSDWCVVICNIFPFPQHYIEQLKVAQNIIFLCMTVPPLQYPGLICFFFSLIIGFIEYGGCECLFALYFLLCNKLNRMLVNPPKLLSY